MKKFIFTLFLLILIAAAAHSQWKQLPGPQGADIRSFGYKNLNTLYCGTFGTGFFISNNAGTSWAVSNSGLTENGKYIYSILYFNSKIFIGTQDGVYKSLDGGASWTATAAINGNPIIYSIVSIGSTLYIGTTGGAYYSSDEGTSWNPTALTSFLTFLFTDNTNLFAGPIGGLQKSTDNGATWANIINGMQPDISVYAMIKFNGRLFAGTNYGVYYSMDAGSSWTQMNTGISYPDLYVSDFTSNSTNLFVSVSDAGIFRLNAAMTNWTQVKAGDYSKLFGNSNELLAGATSGMFKSVNNGGAWTDCNKGLCDMTIRASASTSARVYAACYASSACNCLYKSEDFGSTWMNISPIAGLSNFILCVDAKGTKVFAGSRLSSLYRSTNSGKSWTNLDVDGWLRIISVDINNVNNNIIYAGTSNTHSAPSGEVYKSTDNGDTWTQMTAFHKPIFCLKSQGDLVIAATQPAFYRSTDAGVNWQRIDSVYINCLEMSGKYIYASKADGGLISSTNKGATWFSITNNIGDSNITSLAAISGNVVYAGTASGVYLSVDGGKTWKAYNSGFSSLSVTSVTVNDSYVFAGIDGMRMWRRPQNTPRANLLSEANDGLAPQEFSLKQNYPNPFNPVTKISFEIPVNAFVKLSVYDILGKEIVTLVNEYKTQGSYSAEFSGNQLSSGVYFYKLETPGFTDIKRMILIK